MEDRALPRILPFLAFMLFIGAEEAARWFVSDGFISFPGETFYYAYPVRAVVVTILLAYFWKSYRELCWNDLLNISQSIISIVAGSAIFLLWINLDAGFATQGNPPGFDPNHFGNEAVKMAMITIRLAGAVLLVPVMEELFWRSFLIRYITSWEFNKTPIGYFTWPSFLITVVLFGLEHHYILAGISAGIIFNCLLYYTKSITQCILSHAVANLALGIYVLLSGEWRFW